MFGSKNGIMQKLREFFESGGEGDRYDLLTKFAPGRSKDLKGAMYVQTLIQDLKKWYRRRGQTLGLYKNGSRLGKYKLFNDEIPEETQKATNYVAGVLAQDAKKLKQNFKDANVRFTNDVQGRFKTLTALSEISNVVTKQLQEWTAEEQKALTEKQED